MTSASKEGITLKKGWYHDVMFMTIPSQFGFTSMRIWLPLPWKSFNLLMTSFATDCRVLSLITEAQIKQKDDEIMDLEKQAPLAPLHELHYIWHLIVNIFDLFALFRRFCHWFDEYRDLYKCISQSLCTIYFCCDPSSYPSLAASRQQSHLYKAGRGKGQEHEVRGDLPWDPVRCGIDCIPFQQPFFLANGCNSGMGKDVNDGQQRKVLLVIKCTEDKIQYMWNDVMIYIYVICI